MTLKNKVIFINDVKQEDEKPVEFTEYLNTRKGSVDAISHPSEFARVVYLGYCKLKDIDVFSATTNNGEICIYYGHLNSGKY